MTAILSGLGIGLAIGTSWWLIYRSGMVDGAGIAGLIPFAFLLLFGQILAIHFAVDPDFAVNRGAGVYTICYLAGIALFFIGLKLGRKLIKFPRAATR